MIFKKNGSNEVENSKQENENKFSDRYSPEIKKKLFSSSHNFFTNKNLKNSELNNNTKTNNFFNTDITSLSKLKNINKASPIKLHAIKDDQSNKIELENCNEKKNNNNNNSENSVSFQEEDMNINENHQKINCITERNVQDENKYQVFTK